MSRSRVRVQFAAHDVRRHLESWELSIARRLPRWLRYWAVVVAACDSTNGNPGEVTASEMLKKMERPPRPLWGGVRASHLLRAVRR
jgi:hypothetical protein